MLRARRGARLAALTSGGAIPDIADYRVVADPDDTFVGTVNEDWAIESMAGDIFLLGTTSWQIRRVETGVVRVRDAEGGRRRSRSGSARRRRARRSSPPRSRRCAPRSRRGCCATKPGAGRAVAGGRGGPRRQRRRAGRALPGRGARGARRAADARADVVLERFFDDTGGMQLVIHAPFGGRVNRALGLALRKRFCRSFDFELQAAASDDAIVLSLGPQQSAAARGLPRHARGARTARARRWSQAVLPSPMFTARWRWNLGRALVVLRMRGGKKNPPPIQRMEADDLMAAIFPALAQCQENAHRADRDARPSAGAPDARTTACTRRWTSTRCEALLRDDRVGRGRACTPATRSSRRRSRTRS